MLAGLVRDTPSVAQFRWTAESVLERVQRQRHSEGQGWMFFRELRVSSGFARSGIAEQRLDAFALHEWPSQQNCRVVYEVKTARSDFLNEIKKKPYKRRIGLALSNLFYFVAPRGIIRPEEIPPECGFIELTEGPMKFDPYAADYGWRYGPAFPFHCSTVIEAPYRDTASPPWRFVVSLVRRGPHTLEL